ncbi:MAG TPA: undecaprenyldiphospho-muramoylpentapeptide beta-N-acetylglucosaminyltransferase, partial [Actinobacteria bacterium]|nr:undecaprenyldiphospho-muramoylpentapeptide beta-N-acetylglucosaminyltransferase [Actinomycetota bacterium]
FESLGILREFKPSLVVGMGGYVSFPLVSMAAVLGIPTAIHEQNAYPGLANRLLGRVAKVIAVSYPGTKDYFSPRRKIILTGNPVRRGVRASHREDALRAFGLDSSRRTLLIFGGSRGARRINRAFLEAYDFFRDADDLQIIHITGEGEYDVFLKTMNTLRRTDDRVIYQCHPYLTTIDLAYAAADLVLCRAGATTIAEITAKGIPAVLVPYPYSTAAHQEKNARYLENYGAARVVLDGDLNGRSMYEAVSILIHDDEGLRRMRESSLSLGRPRAAEELASLVEEQSKR